MIDWIIGYCKGGVGDDTALFYSCFKKKIKNFEKLC